jgi:NAD(P)-dependent dehydrogenase (short-subunit alcohol dehydrogenase family)
MAASGIAGKVVLITGAGRGMGRATAELFAVEGAKVVVSDIDAASGTETAEAIGKDGGTVAFVAADVSDEAEVAALVRACVDLYGQLDCAVNNAALVPDHVDIVDEDVEVFDRLLRVNLRSVFLGIKHQARQMLTQDSRGTIVNIGSTTSVRPLHTGAGYTATKHAVVGLTKTASTQLAPRGIRVNAVLPGATLTPMMEVAMERRGVTEAEQAATFTVMGRLARPREIAHGTLWLCSDAASFVTGHALAVDGGYLSM